MATVELLRVALLAVSYAAQMRASHHFAVSFGRAPFPFVRKLVALLVHSSLLLTAGVPDAAPPRAPVRNYEVRPDPVIRGCVGLVVTRSLRELRVADVLGSCPKGPTRPAQTRALSGLVSSLCGTGRAQTVSRVVRLVLSALRDLDNSYLDVAQLAVCCLAHVLVLGVV